MSEEKKELTVSGRDEICDKICEFSDREVVPQVKERLNAFKGRPNAEIKDEFLGLIDDVIHCAWTNNFVLKVLQMVWKGMGGSREEAYSRKITKENYEELRQKYKWQVDRSGSY